MPGLKALRWGFLRRVRYPAALHPHHHRRGLLTLAIETSCDDTSVAILERTNQSSHLHFHSTVTSNNLAYRGIHPIVALQSHQRNLAGLINTALSHLPVQDSELARLENSLLVDEDGRDGLPRKKPDFVAVTRGPGMRSSLNMGLDTAKGLAVAWRVPLVAVHHMQAHALTPRLVSSLKAGTNPDTAARLDPEFPFLSLLVSGGHTMVIHSKGLVDHEILVDTMDMAIGDTIDKCARDILPSTVLESSETVMYGRLLEEFAFPNGTRDYEYLPPATTKEGWKPRETGYEWILCPPLSTTGPYRSLMQYSFAGTTSSIKRIMTSSPSMSKMERRILAQQTMLVTFEHLATRLLSALESKKMKSINSIVVSGGVASNQYLKHVLRAILDTRGFAGVKLLFPPPSLCTDNAAMIAWTGMEMWDAGYRSDLDVEVVQKWPINGLCL